MDEKRISLAAIAGAHGIGGEMRLKLFAESLDSLKLHKVFDAGGQTLTLKSARQTNKLPIARFAEVTDRNGAEALRGTELTIAREALPQLDDDEYYHSDVVGRCCVSDQGEALGTIFGIYEFGAGDVFEIERGSGKKFMVPAKAIDVRNDPAIVRAEFVE